MSIEAMKQALQALDLALSDEPYFVKAGIAMVSLRQAIQQAEQEVDWEAVAADQAMTIAMMKQREWVGLTNDEITEIDQGLDARSYSLFAYTRAIEAKLKEKNT
jgi:LytS/YehU family sensor histidine kinase